MGSKIITLTQTPKLRVAKIKGFTVLFYLTITLEKLKYQKTSQLITVFYGNILL